MKLYNLRPELCEKCKFSRYGLTGSEISRYCDYMDMNKGKSRVFDNGKRLYDGHKYCSKYKKYEGEDKRAWKYVECVGNQKNVSTT